jgi:UDP-2,3-diacylglucosamine hydrolase
MGLFWSKRSRLANIAKEDKLENQSIHHEERLIRFAEDEATKNPELNFLIFGHRHIPLQQKVGAKAEVIILGDWIGHFSYGVFEEGKMRIEYFGKEKSI